jgi:hypothetical protein
MIKSYFLKTQNIHEGWPNLSQCLAESLFRRRVVNGVVFYSNQ